MEFFSALALVDVLQELLKQGEVEHEREGRGARAVDYTVRVACDDTSERAVPVALKAADGTVWITAYNADGELPSVVEEALGVSGGELMDLADAEERARRF
ncbi:hypothetical protein [Streptomyces platensis]|uniref:hypothetical protein n=1 Tax=Streptomyces platensis TaxID=58346 RepID=UPI002E822CBE|nr:hypothetical protein [Streptomyces platensis]WUB82325.1 hypothetical protein OG424_25945 [Streptomyces platensis]